MTTKVFDWADGTYHPGNEHILTQGTFESRIFNFYRWDIFVSRRGIRCNTPSQSLTWPLKSYLPNRKVVFQPPFFRGELLNFGGVSCTFRRTVSCYWLLPKCLDNDRAADLTKNCDLLRETCPKNWHDNGTSTIWRCINMGIVHCHVSFRGWNFGCRIVNS